MLNDSAIWKSLSAPTRLSLIAGPCVIESEKLCFQVAAALKKTCESLGGKLHSFFFSFGDYDATVIVELPDNKAAAALALAVGGSGALSKYTTTVLMTTAEAVEAMKAAKKVSYMAPQ